MSRFWWNRSSFIFVTWILCLFCRLEDGIIASNSFLLPCGRIIRPAALPRDLAVPLPEWGDDVPPCLDPSGLGCGIYFATWTWVGGLRARSQVVRGLASLNSHSSLQEEDAPGGLVARHMKQTWTGLAIWSPAEPSGTEVSPVKSDWAPASLQNHECKIKCVRSLRVHCEFWGRPYTASSQRQ